LSELRYDNEKGYQLRGYGVRALLGEMRDEVGMRKIEAMSLTRIAIRVMVE
jgi:DNA-directed RNA polymerase specialized sigma subunit